MKKNLLSMRLLVFFLAMPIAFFTSDIVNAQVAVYPATAAQCMQDIIDSAVVVSNPTLECPDSASGVFITTASNLGLSQGVVLTTGTANTWGANLGVNILNGGQAANELASTANGTPGDPDLTALASVATHDACIIQFDVTPTWDTLLFNYVFGSEEYTDYSCSEFNDVFGFFLTGPGYTSPTNIAIIPGTNNIPVAINSINNGPTGGNDSSNCTAMGPGSPFTAYYVNNLTGTTITYDGLTQVLTAKAAVTAGATYHLKLGVADASDDVYDSGVFLAGGSLHSKPGRNTTSVNNVNANKFFVYPNPFQSQCSINVPAEFMNKVMTATITDINGSSIYNYDGVGNGLNKALMSTSGHLSPGSYILTIGMPETHFKQTVMICKD